jgi:hypothetical protein
LTKNVEEDKWKSPALATTDIFTLMVKSSSAQVAVAGDTSSIAPNVDGKELCGITENALV